MNWKFRSIFLLCFVLFGFFTNINNLYSNNSNVSTELEFIMFHSPKCSYCKAFMNEAFADFENNTQIPLIVINILDPIPEWLREAHNTGKINLATIRGTPTFILYDGIKERGRITGYNSYDWFYERVDILLNNINSNMQ